MLGKGIECPLCDKTMPMPRPEASVSKVKGKEKSEKSGIEVVVRAPF